MNSQTFSDSNLLNYKINKRKKLTPLNQDFFNSNIGSIFHKKKINYDIFSPKPDAEEIPAFSFENDRNIKNYKNYINNKSACVEKNVQDYIRYIKKFEKPKQHNTLNTPYIFYQEKNSNENHIYKNNKIPKNIIDINKTNNNNNSNNNKFNTLNNNNKDNFDSLINDNNKNIIADKNKLYLDVNNYLNNINSNKKKINLKKNYFNSLSKNLLNKDNNDNNDIVLNNQKVLMPSLSSNEIFSIGNNEISNPSSYYKKYDEDYYRYRLEQKKYLDFNYKFMMNKDYQKNKKEPNVNPYNPKYNAFRSNKSDLPHNPILNPINHYGYNKYLRKELNIKENDKIKKFFKNYLYSNNSINNNINSRNNKDGFIGNENEYKSE